MTRHGRLILVTGYLGAGKTTLIAAAIAQIPGLRYLTTVTTRPPREEEMGSSSGEYEHVSQIEYNRRRAASKMWDHTEFAGYSYGADAAKVNSLLEGGTNIICHILPDEVTINAMTALYAAKPVIVWIDTSRVEADKRLANAGDPERTTRGQYDVAVEAIKDLADVTFIPSMQLEDDKHAFTETVKQLL